MNSAGCWTPSSVSVSPCYRSWRQNSPNYQFLGDHGPQNFSQAIADSNDIFFYQVADWIWNQTGDKDWLPKYYERWGFGQLTGIDISGETEGAYPNRAGREGALQGAARHLRGGLLERGGLGQPLHRPGRPARLADPDGPRVLGPLQRRDPRHPARRQGDHGPERQVDRGDLPRARGPGGREPAPDRHRRRGPPGRHGEEGDRRADLQGLEAADHRQERHGRTADGRLRQLVRGLDGGPGGSHWWS